MKKIELDIVALSQTMAQSNNYAVVLSEKEGNRRLPIIIGKCEAQSIAIALEGMQPSRPLTHDLMKNLFTVFSVQLKEVIINNLVEGVFYARLVCVVNGETVEVDARSSDAIALVVRHECPIYTYEFILEAAGLELKDDDSPASEESQQSETDPSYSALDLPSDDAIERQAEFKKYTLDKLKKMLAEAIEKEDYRKAAQIRDELNKR